MRPDDCLGEDCDEVRERCRLEARIAELEARAAKAERERDEAKKALEFTYCAYCGATFAADHSGSAAVSKHIAVCPDHPMRVIERERDEALEECRQCRADIRRLVEVRDEALAEVERLKAQLYSTRNTLFARATDVQNLQALVKELERERDEARAERDEGQKRIEKLDAALQFYAGRKREDGNGYEFDDEPSRITGGVARAALRAVLR